MFKTSMLRSDLCGYSDAYIAGKETITIEGDNDPKRRNENLVFKNNFPFRSCISKFTNTSIGNTENPNIVMPMYNLLEYNDNYSRTFAERLRNYYRDEVNNDNNKNNKTVKSKTF